MNRGTEEGRDTPALPGHQLSSVILAAGHSARMGRHKALLKVSRTEEAWSRILKHHLDCGLTPRLVVSEELAKLLRPVISEAILLINPQPEKGPLSSLQLALRELDSAFGVLLHPVDHPLVAVSTVLRLKSLNQRSPDRILVPTSNGRKGHPVVFGAQFVPDLLAAPLDQGARFVVRANPGAVRLVEVADEGILANLNRREDLRRWRKRGYRLGRTSQ